MISLAGPQEDSIYAARGTAAHTVAEWCLREERVAAEFLGRTVKVGKFEIEIDEEIVDSVQTYVDVVNHERIGGTLFIEERGTLEALDPPFDAGGTCDAKIIKGSKLKMLDFKHGTHAVEIEANAQLRSYALMGLLSLSPDEAAEIDTVISMVVQPRAYHRDGRIRGETIHVADLYSWGWELKQAMLRAKDAFDSFNALGGDRTAFEAWAEEHLRAGACDWCPALAICPKQRRKVLTTVPADLSAHFEDPDTVLTVPDVSLIQSPEELAHILDGLSALEDWISSVRNYAHAAAERGMKIPGWRLVEKIGNRAWKDEDIAAAGLLDAGIPAHNLYSAPKLISPAQADKLLGAKRKGEIADLWEKPVRGTNLTRDETSSRPTVQPMVERFFEEPQDTKTLQDTE